MRAFSKEIVKHSLNDGKNRLQKNQIKYRVKLKKVTIE